MPELTALEEQVLQMMLRGDDETRTVLRQQLHFLQVSSRRFTGVGFFCDFAIDLKAPRIVGRPKLELGGVAGTAQNLKHGLGFVLFVVDGALSMLEGYTYDEPWPDELHDWRLNFLEDPATQ